MCKFERLASCVVELDAVSADINSMAAADAARGVAREADISALAARVEACVSRLDARARVVVFGSSRSGLGAAGCDVDMCALRPGAAAADAAPFLAEVGDALAAAGFSGVEVVSGARVPIARFIAEDATTCDLCVNNELAIANTELLRAYSCADARVRPLVLAVKRWARARGVNAPATGTLSSYTYAIMVVAFLQARGVLPHLQDPALLRAQPPARVCGHDTAFASAEGGPFTAEDGGGGGGDSVGELLRGFFEYYGAEFPFRDGVVSVRGAFVCGRVSACCWLVPTCRSVHAVRGCVRVLGLCHQYFLYLSVLLYFLHVCLLLLVPRAASGAPRTNAGLCRRRPRRCGAAEARPIQPTPPVVPERGGPV